MAYFVTGATGFIGRRLIAELVDHRRGTIWVLVRPGSEEKLDRYPVPVEQLHPHRRRSG